MINEKTRVMFPTSFIDKPQFGNFTMFAKPVSSPHGTSFTSDQQLLTLAAANDHPSQSALSTRAAQSLATRALMLRMIEAACDESATGNTLRLGTCAAAALKGIVVDPDSRKVLQRAAVHLDQTFSAEAQKLLRTDQDPGTVELLVGELSKNRSDQVKFDIVRGLIHQSLSPSAHETLSTYVRAENFSAADIYDYTTSDLSPLVKFMDRTTIIPALIQMAQERRKDGPRGYDIQDLRIWQALRHLGNLDAHVDALCDLYRKLPTRLEEKTRAEVPKELGVIAGEVMAPYAARHHSVYRAMLKRWGGATSDERKVLGPVFDARIATDKVLGFCLGAIDAAPVPDRYNPNRDASKIVAALYKVKEFRETVGQVLRESPAIVAEVQRAVGASGFADGPFVSFFSRAVAARNFNLSRTVEDLVVAAEKGDFYHRLYAFRFLPGRELTDSQVSRLAALASTQTYGDRSSALGLIARYPTHPAVKLVCCQLHREHPRDLTSADRTKVSNLLSAQFSDPEVRASYIQQYSSENYRFDETDGRLLLKHLADGEVRACCVRLFRHLESSWSAFDDDCFFNLAPFALLDYAGEPEVLSALTMTYPLREGRRWKQLRDELSARIVPGDAAYTKLFADLKTHNCTHTFYPLQVLARCAIAPEQADELVATIAIHGRQHDAIFSDVGHSYIDSGLIERLRNNSSTPGTAELRASVQRALSDDRPGVRGFAAHVVREARLNFST